MDLFTTPAIPANNASRSSGALAASAISSRKCVVSSSPSRWKVWGMGNFRSSDGSLVTGAGVAFRARLNLLHDLDAGTGADPRGARLDHFAQVLERAHASTGLHAHAVAGDEMHQSDVARRGAAGGKSRGRFHEVGAGGARNHAGGDFFLIVQQRRFKNHLGDRARGVANLYDAANVAFHEIPI